MFTTAASSGLKFRTGRLQISPTASSSTTTAKEDSIETPNFTLSTQFLLANPYLLPTLLRKVIGKSPIISYPLGDILSFISSAGNNNNAINSLKFGDRVDFCVILSLRSPISSEPSIFGRPFKSFQVSSMCGRRSVDESTYFNSVRTFEPNIIIYPAEELAVSTRYSEKICARSVHEAHDALQEISSYFDKEFANNKRHKSILNQPKDREHLMNSTDNFTSQFGRLANLQGGADISYRTRACELVLEYQKQHDTLLGVSIGGLGYEEDIISRTSYLNASLSPLLTDSSGNSLIRFLVLQDGNPLEILHAISNGVDIVECTYPIKCASVGIALTFSVEMEQFESESTDLFSNFDIKKWKPQHLDLTDKRYENCFERITEISPCQESKAYIHHLLVTKEMLAEVILTMHNIFSYVKLFEKIRNHIKNGDFHLFVEWFLKTQQVL